MAGPPDVTEFLAIFNFPWIIKPIYGVLSDLVPLFGYRRKSYLIARQRRCGRRLACGATAASRHLANWWWALPCSQPTPWRSPARCAEPCWSKMVNGSAKAAVFRQSAMALVLTPPQWRRLSVGGQLVQRLPSDLRAPHRRGHRRLRAVRLSCSARLFLIHEETDAFRSTGAARNESAVSSPR